MANITFFYVLSKTKRIKGGMIYLNKIMNYKLLLNQWGKREKTVSLFADCLFWFGEISCCQFILKFFNNCLCFKKSIKMSEVHIHLHILIQQPLIPPFHQRLQPLLDAPSTGFSFCPAVQ